MGRYGITWDFELRQEKPRENRGLAILRMAPCGLPMAVTKLQIEKSGTNHEYGKNALTMVNAPLTKCPTFVLLGAGGRVPPTSPVPDGISPATSRNLILVAEVATDLGSRAERDRRFPGAQQTVNRRQGADRRGYVLRTPPR